MKLVLQTLLFTLLVPGTVAVYVPLLLARGRLPAAGLQRVAAVALLACAAATYGWCAFDFVRSGRGTPFPLAAPRRLVARGLYRYTRNPMYVGVLLALGGWALLLRSPLHLAYALAVATCFELFVVLYEEPRLTRQFGPEYLAYTRRVGRWLPRLPRRAQARRHDPR
jgi:protein-S-isoprenylcysteine O-methyltransferase Ste14